MLRVIEKSWKFMTGREMTKLVEMTALGSGWCYIPLLLKDQTGRIEFCDIRSTVKALIHISAQ
jgi:hypothetical protein